MRNLFGRYVFACLIRRTVESRETDFTCDRTQHQWPTKYVKRNCRTCTRKRRSTRVVFVRAFDVVDILSDKVSARMLHLFHWFQSGLNSRYYVRCIDSFIIILQIDRTLWTPIYNNSRPFFFLFVRFVRFSDHFYFLFLFRIFIVQFVSNISAAERCRYISFSL